MSTTGLSGYNTKYFDNNSFCLEISAHSFLLLFTHLPVGGARDSDPHGAGRSVPGQAYYAHVVAEVLAPKLGPDAHVLGQLVDLLLKVNVTERSAMFIA